MAHINPNKLVDTITIYNVWKDPNTGKSGYWRSFVQQVRLMDKASTVNVASIGWTRVVTQEMLVDAQNSIAYSADENDNQVTKVYAEPSEWAAMSTDQKQAFWTMQEGDYVVPGECEIIIPPDAVTKLTALRPRKIGSVNMVRQKGGDTNHWEVSLV